MSDTIEPMTDVELKELEKLLNLDPLDWKFEVHVGAMNRLIARLRLAEANKPKFKVGDRVFHRFDGGDEYRVKAICFTYAIRNNRKYRADMCEENIELAPPEEK